MAVRKSTISAAELMAELKSNPEWVRRDDEREAKRQAADAWFKIEEQPIADDLAKLGTKISSAWDLVNSSERYSEAIPVLLEHIRRPYHHRVREGIARALAVQEAEGIAGRTVIDVLKSEQVSGVRWALANTLTIVADQNDADAIASLIDDPSYEDVRERLKQALRNVRPKDRRLSNDAPRNA